MVSVHFSVENEERTPLIPPARAWTMGCAADSMIISEQRARAVTVHRRAGRCARPSHEFLGLRERSPDVDKTAM